jgi:hypothetical protein
VLAVHGLLGDAEPVGDVLPRPAGSPRRRDTRPEGKFLVPRKLVVNREDMLEAVVVSFVVHARRVRDPHLPLRRRLSALSSCVVLYCPFGFHGTLAFLELEAGAFHGDENALLRALDVLEDLRARWQAEAAAYAEIRRAEKRAGRRVPDPRVLNPYLRLWQDDLATGAKYRLRLWADRAADRPTRVPADALETAVQRCVRACLECRFGAEEVAHLGNCLGAVERRLARSTSSDEYRRWRKLLDVARLVQQATAG